MINNYRMNLKSIEYMIFKVDFFRFIFFENLVVIIEN